MDVQYVCGFIFIIKSLSALIEPPSAGPYTQIKGGNRPFKIGDNLTHVCVVEGGMPKPVLKWICLTQHRSEKTSIIDNKVFHEITLELTDQIVHHFYNCACHAHHSSWNGAKLALSQPVLVTTKPVPGRNVRQLYTAGPGKPLTIKVDYYAYPGNVSFIVIRNDYRDLVSENITKITQQSKDFKFTVNGITYVSEGETAYWKLEHFNETDYGLYKMQLENDIGMARVYFNITERGPPSEPFNVNISNINNEGFTVSFTPGHDGGYPQTFVVVCWPQGNTHRQRTTTSTSTTIHVRHLVSSTAYQCMLHAENELGRSLPSNIEPLPIVTKVGVGEGSHQLSYVVYVVGCLCTIVLVSSVVGTIVNRCRRRTFVEAVPHLPDVPPRATLNTDRGVYTDRAVYRRTHGLPDAATVDRMSTLVVKPRRVTKIPPILAVFRKSRGLPDVNVISDVQDAVSRSNSNIANGHANGNAASTEEDVVRIRKPPASLPRDLNYPDIEIRHSSPRTPTIRRPRQRTNYSQIDFDVPVPPPDRHDLEDVSDATSSNYQQIFFQSATLPPRAAKS